jgi:hypothetical protein
LEDWKVEWAPDQVYELALALGQDEDVVRQVKAGKLHPVMLAFGIWRDEPEFETLTAEIYANRRRQGSLAQAEWTE